MSQTTYLICPACQAKNRIPAERIYEAPSCGRCKAPLFPARPPDLTETTLNKHLAVDGVPLVVDFWAPWCGPCKMMAPMFAKAAGVIAPAARFAKINTEDFPTLGQRYEIRGIPLMILFAGGQEIARTTGAMDADGIARWLMANLPGRSADTEVG